MVEINWSVAENTLYGKTRDALRDFAREHSGEEFSFFAYRADYCYGQIYLCLDTPGNARQRAIENCERIQATRKTLFGRPGGWDRARYFIARHADRTIDYTYTASLFQYDSFAQIQYRDWEKYFRSDQYSEQYQFENRVIVLFWQVLERLVEEGAFDELNHACPFRTGFEFHDNDLGLVVLQLLNWSNQR